MLARVVMEEGSWLKAMGHSQLACDILKACKQYQALWLTIHMATVVATKHCPLSDESDSY